MLLNQADPLLNFLGRKLETLFLSLGSNFSAASLFSALCIAIVIVLLRRRPGKRNVKFRVMLRALFPRRLLRGASSRADLGLLLINVFAAGTLLGWAMFSSQYINRGTNQALAHTFGALPATALNDFVSRSLVTVSLFLAYELAYWTNHYLSHRIPLLWEFHKVHHTAEVLSPMTNFRVHPVDGLVFYNFVAVFVGVTGGVLSYLLGRPVAPFALNNSNLIAVAFVFLIVHLQHSHLWIAATGRLGFVLFSPAHHQLHHSDNPAHFDKNFGFCLALWDGLFGTLQMPTRERERLNFGMEPRARSDHTATGALVLPFVRAWQRLRPAQTERPALNAAAPR
jgi:sterol desaturase/sphingolipid hydroxylase (fatty acid hydroxylase superfamily)